MTTVIPDAAWRAPILRELDPLARSTLAAASSVRRFVTGAKLWGEHDAGDAIVLIIAGTVELRCVRRGDEHPSRLRLATAGDTLGEEALLGLPRRAEAIAIEGGTLVEIPAALFVRGGGRSGAAAVDRERRALERQATRDLVRTLALGRHLPDDDLDLVLDAVRSEHFERGARIFGAGEPAQAAFLLVDGLVQLQTEDDERVHVRAYLARGDTFGDDDALAGHARSYHAVALGAVHALRVPAQVLRTVVDRNPGLLGEIQRIAGARAELQQQVVGAAAAQSTQHVFKDLYRMQMARSLLVIDQDTCVRCGHCAWTCSALHGTSRLVRRGDKVITRLPVLGAQPRSLLLPNSCQHCKNPACMIDCPTGAIGRDPQGEVFIREELCTGCGNCAKACPWDNIRMAERAASEVAVKRTLKLSADVAVKCDLCRTWSEPGCVTMCPTGAILRLDPSRDVREVADVLGVPDATKKSRLAIPFAAIGGTLFLSLAIALGTAALDYQRTGAWKPELGSGKQAGIVAAVCILLLLAHVIVKRVPWLFMRRRTRRAAIAGVPQGAPRSKVKPWYRWHLVVGMAAPVAVLAHAGTRMPDGPAGALAATFWATVLLGVLGGLAYAIVPRRLTRLERDGALPEDLRRRRADLVDRLYRAGSGKSELVKAIADKVLVPYARSTTGPLTLLLSGRTLAEEEARVRARVHTVLQGRGAEKLGGLDELVRIVVELRALPLRRMLTTIVRGFLPLHLIASSLLLALLAVHILVVVGR